MKKKTTSVGRFYNDRGEREREREREKTHSESEPRGCDVITYVEKK